MSSEQDLGKLREEAYKAFANSEGKNSDNTETTVSEPILEGDNEPDGEGINESSKDVIKDGEIRESEDKETTKKKKSNVEKLLSQRNKYRKEAEELRNKLEDLRHQNNLDESMDEYISKAIDQKFSKRDAELIDREEKYKFLNKFPEAVEVENGIKEIRDEFPNMSYEAAYRFYLANEDPVALLDKQQQNKKKSGATSITGTTPSKPTLQDMSLEELRGAAFKEFDHYKKQGLL